MTKNQPWRPRYALRLGLRPSQRDEETDEVRAVECCFCAAFGREPPDERKRARTAKVANWKAPFRPDNIRSHLRVQHQDKWREYSELVQQLKLWEDREAAEWQLKAFFEAEETMETLGRKKRRAAVETAEDAVETAVETAVVAVEKEVEVPAEEIDTEVVPPEDDGDTIRKELLEVTTLETLVDGFYVDDDAFVNEEAKDLQQRLVGGSHTQQQKANILSEFALTVEGKQELENVQKLLGIGLTFTQAANCVAPPLLTADMVRRYARLLVARSLRMISNFMRCTWAYSIALQVLCGTIGKAALQLRVRIPVARGTDVVDLHVIALLLPSFKNSPKRIAVIVELVLKTLDPEWRLKLLGGCVNGVVSEMGVHATLLDDLIQQSTNSCLYQVWRPARIVESCLRNVPEELGNYAYERSLMESSSTNEKRNFLKELATLTTILRGYEPWVRVHGRCPLLDPACPWSVLKVLQWLMARRHIILAACQDNPSVQVPPSRFWIVSSFFIDILSGLNDVYRSLESFPLPSRAECNDMITKCVNAIMNKCKVSRVMGGNVAAHDDVHLQGDDLLRGEFRWARKATLVPYLRSLNLSSRRLYDQMPLGDKRYVEWLIAGFILSILHFVCNNSGLNFLDEVNPTSRGNAKPVGLKTILCDVPPTLPLDFASIDREAAVDLIERYCEQLQQAHGLVFLDNISNEIELLKTMLANNASLRMKIRSAQTMSFRSAWETVPQLNSLREFASALATVLPRIGGGPIQLLGAETATAVIGALHERDEDQHRSNFGDLSVEVRLHIGQVQEVQALHSE